MKLPPWFSSFEFLLVPFLFRPTTVSTASHYKFTTGSKRFGGYPTSPLQVTYTVSGCSGVYWQTCAFSMECCDPVSKVTKKKANKWWPVCPRRLESGRNDSPVLHQCVFRSADINIAVGCKPTSPSSFRWNLQTGRETPTERKTTCC